MGMVETRHSDQLRASNDHPEGLAKHAIRLLERQIHREFGAVLRLGAEVEYSLVPRHPDAVGIEQRKPIHIESEKDQLQARGFAPAIRQEADQNTRFSSRKPETSHYGAHLDIDLTRQHHALNDDADIPRPWHEGTTRLTNLRDPIFPDSHYIAYSYDEFTPGMHEAVISHEGRHDSLPPDGRRALTFARSIAALRSTMSDCADLNRRFARDAEHNALLAEAARDWSVNFAPALPHRNSVDTQGLHINLTVHKENGERLGKQQRLLAPLQTMFSDGAYLLLTNALAFMRESERKLDSIPDQCARMKDGATTNDHIEICRPASDSNAYYATLLTLLGVYDGLKHPARPPHENPLFAHNEAAYKERFHAENNRVIAALNALEPNLGARFRTAIAKYPPGTEQAVTRSR
jgi:hypothetical protein